MDKDAELLGYIKKFVDRYRVSLIPLRYVRDKGVLSGKVPAITQWTDYCHDLPTDDDIDSWQLLGSERSGVGLVCGEASNLGCIDLDTEDEDLGKRLMACIPNEAVRIIGNPKRPGKFLFRLKEFPGDEIKLRSTSFGPIDLMISGKQIAIPPTYHTKDKVMYRWDERFGIRDGEFPDVDMLPVLESYHVEALKRVLDGELLSDINATSPRGAINLDLSTVGTGDGRYNDMKRQIATLQKSRTPIAEAVRWLVEYDYTRNGSDNMVFLTKERSTPDPRLNCARWYINQLCNNSRGKSLKEIELPTDFADTSKSVDINVEEYPGWDRPIMPESLPEPPPFALEVIPDIWRNLVEDAASANNVPAEACFMILATQLGSILGNKRWIRPKKNNTGYCEAHNIYTVYVSPSGSRKSQMLRIMSEPIRRLQKRIDGEYEKELQKFQQQLELIEPQIQELEKRVKEESKQLLDDEGNKSYLESMQQKLENLREMAVPPSRHQLIINSATPEKLLSIMEDNPSGSMLVFNELSDLLNKFKKPGYESFKELIMNAWDGYQSYTHQTKNSGSIRIDNMCLGLYAAIQPSMFNKHIEEIYEGNNDDGFWQRLFIILNLNGNDPKAVDIDFNHDQYFDEYEIYHKAYEVGDGDSITFTEDARQLFMEFETRMSSMAQNEGNGAISSYWAKNIGKLASMSSIMQFLMNKGEMHQKVTAEAVQRAMYLVERQINHIRNIFPNDPVIGLTDVIEDMKSGLMGSQITMRNLKRDYKRYFGDHRKRNRLLSELQKRNIIKREKQGQSEIVHISPYVY